MRVCLIGNPNCGKTTLFNALTGTYQKVGNFTGVTVEKKEGVYKKDKSISVVDLPGLYSLDTNSLDERVVSDYLKSNDVDVLINVLDGTNLSRNLHLTCELSKLNIKTVLAVNFADDLEKNGITLNEKMLSDLFGVSVVKISALKNTNIDKLMSETKSAKFLKKIDGDYYAFIDSCIGKIIDKKTTRAEKITYKLDDVLTNKYLGIPIFFLCLSLVYFLSYKVGGIFGKIFENGFLNFSVFIENLLRSNGVYAWLIGLISAVFNGITSVLSFLPQILILFFFLTIMEESGYSSRCAFIFDRLFRGIGLSGKSLIPLMLSCGCSVTGLMSTRTIRSEDERIRSIYLSPMMPCSAKTAVFGWFSAVFFDGNPFVSSSLYILSIICVGVFGALLKVFFGKGDGVFLLEMPTYRFPTIKDVFVVLKEKSKDFLYKAGSLIFILSVAVWFLGNFGFSGYTDGRIEGSFLYLIGNAVKYLFLPFGFCSWESGVAIISGLFAREAVIETLIILPCDINSVFTNGYEAYSFMVFILLMPPCVASLSVAKKELKNGKLFANMILFQTFSAYFISLIISLIGKIMYKNGLLLSVIVVIILTVVFEFLIKNSLKGCTSCKRCKKMGGICRKR